VPSNIDIKFNCITLHWMTFTKPFILTTNGYLKSHIKINALIKTYYTKDTLLSNNF